MLPSNCNFWPAGKCASLFNSLLGITTTTVTKLFITVPLWRVHLWRVDSRIQGPITPKVIPCKYVMYYGNLLSKTYWNRHIFFRFFFNYTLTGHYFYCRYRPNLFWTIALHLPEQMMPLLPEQMMPLLPEQMMPLLPEQMTPLLPEQMMPLLPEQMTPLLPEQMMPFSPTQLRSGRKPEDRTVQHEAVMTWKHFIQHCRKCPVAGNFGQYDARMTSLLWTPRISSSNTERLEHYITDDIPSGFREKIK